MQGSPSRDWGFRRFFSEAIWPRILLLSVLPLLSGCIPGMNWGDDGGDSGAPAPEAKNAPALNRSYKSSFLSLQMPSLGAAPDVRGLFMPAAYPAIDAPTIRELAAQLGLSAGRLEATVDALTSLIEPLLIVVMGVCVGGMIISLYLPMFNIIKLIK